MRKSKAEQYKESLTAKAEPETLTLREFATKLVDAGKHRTKEGREMNPTQEAVIFSNSFMDAYMGAAGAAKTSTLCAKGWLRSLFQPGSKGAVCRYDYNKLMMTTKERMEQMLAVLPPGTRMDRDKSPPETWVIKPIVAGPPSYIYFFGLKDPLGSIELDWAIVDEADEVEEKRIQELKMRMRNPLPGMEEGYDPYNISLAFNPPDVTHWLYTACLGLNSKGQKVADPWMKLHMPKYMENSRNLPRGYYEEKGKDLPEDLKMRLVMGQWGTVFPGDPVYRQFKWQAHVRMELLNNYNEYGTLYRLWDFGYNAPACIFVQLDEAGRLLALFEIIKAKVEIQDFAAFVKSETTRQFPHHRGEIRDYGDPAVKQHKDTGSTLAELVKQGIHMNYRTSRIEEGVRLIRTRLGLLLGGEPALQFDQHNCPILINAMKGGYRMNELGTEPKKDGYYEHPADAYRYGCINLLGGGETSSYAAGNLPTNVGYDGAYG